MQRVLGCAIGEGVEHRRLETVYRADVDHARFAILEITLIADFEAAHSGPIRFRE